MTAFIEGGNTIDVDESLLNSSKLNLIVNGTGNYLKIDRPLSAGNVRIQLEGHARVEISRNCLLGSLFIYASNLSSVSIGSNVGFNGAIRLLLHEPRNITIGDECLFGGDVDVTISDMHSIIDASSGERINPAKDIRLAERVWVGQRTTILKGVTIGADSVIGASSVVTRDVPANCIAAGNPAKVVRQGIFWKRELI